MTDTTPSTPDNRPAQGKAQSPAGEATERLQAFAQIVWDARWGKGENAEHSEALDRMVGIAAEIRSGNFASLDAAMRATRQGAGEGKP